MHKGAGGSFACRAKAVAAAAWPRALHGVSATWISLKHLHDLRSRYMAAMRVDKTGSNSFLQLHLDGFGMDPCAFAILQTIRDFRDLGSSDWHLDLLGQVVAQPHDGGQNTVTRVLQKRIELLGWQLVDGDKISDDLGTFPLSTVNWAELCLRFQRSWHKYVHGQVSHRADFAGFQHADFGATRKLFHLQQGVDQGICRRNLNGSTLTNEHSCFWSQSGSHQCRFCGSADSLSHRYWECPASGHLRKSFSSEALQVIAELPPVCIIRSWQVQSPLTDVWWASPLALPRWVDPIVSLHSRTSDDIVDLFTDGSCLWQNSAHYRVAAWSVCLPQLPDTDASNWETHVVASGAVSGLLQTSFRAELTAVAHAVKFARQANVGVRIWADCQAVVDGLALLLADLGRIRANSANADLWTEIVADARDLGCQRVQVVKVAAHETVVDSDSEFERWCKINNACADAAAKAANANRAPEFWQLWERFLERFWACNSWVDKFYNIK